MTTIPILYWAVTVTVFAAITMSGIQLITQQPLNYRNKLIVGIALALVLVLVQLQILQFFSTDVQNIFGKSPISCFFNSLYFKYIVPEDNSIEED